MELQITTTNVRQILTQYDLNLQKAKNKDYGNSFDKTCDEFGPVVMCIRIQDKLQRLERLAANEALVAEKSFDTMLDLLNYALMSKAWFLKAYEINTGADFATSLILIQTKAMIQLAVCPITAMLAQFRTLAETVKRFNETAEFNEQHDKILTALDNLAVLAFADCCRQLLAEPDLLDKRYLPHETDNE